MVRALRNLELRPGEAVVNSWVGGTAFGKRSNLTKMSGALVLTNQRVVFQPRRITVDQKTWVPDGFDFDLDDKVEVTGDENRRAAIKFNLRGRIVALNIAASAMTWTFSKKNRIERDRALEAIHAAMATS